MRMSRAGLQRVVGRVTATARIRTSPAISSLIPAWHVRAKAQTLSCRSGGQRCFSVQGSLLQSSSASQSSGMLDFITLKGCAPRCFFSVLGVSSHTLHLLRLYLMFLVYQCRITDHAAPTAACPPGPMSSGPADHTRSFAPPRLILGPDSLFGFLYQGS